MPTDDIDEVSPVGGDWLWSLPTREGPVHRVDELLPTGYDAYLRLFHPFLSWGTKARDDADRAERRTWRRMAEAAGVAYRPQITWRSLQGVLTEMHGERSFEVWEGELEPLTAAGLMTALAPSTGDQPIYFAFGLAAIIASPQRGRTLLRGRIGSLHAAREVMDQAAGCHVAGVELIWPEDKRWAVRTDYDLPATYIAADHETADRLGSDQALEVLAVSEDTRVDSHADAEPRLGPRAN